MKDYSRFGGEESPTTSFHRNRGIVGLQVSSAMKIFCVYVISKFFRCRNLVDVGCGYGKVLDTFHRFGFSKKNLFGLEIYEKAFDKCVKSGYNVYLTNILEDGLTTLEYILPERSMIYFYSPIFDGFQAVLDKSLQLLQSKVRIIFIIDNFSRKKVVLPGFYSISFQNNRFHLLVNKTH